MISKILKHFGYVKNVPGMVVLDIDEVDIIAEALENYEQRLPLQKYGYFSDATAAAKKKINSIRPGIFAKFTIF